MKKVIAINGSPRRNGNTAELLQQALKGAQEAKAAYRQEMFPKQCAAAYELGRSLLR